MNANINGINLFFEDTGPRNALPVNPQIGFTIPFFAALLGVALIPNTYDTSFLDSCRVWVQGSQDEFTTSAPAA